MKVICCLALLVSCAVAWPRPDDYGGGDDYGGNGGGGEGGCPEGTQPPLPLPTDDQAKQAVVGMTSAMKPKATETSQRYIKLTLPSNDETCPKVTPPSDEEVERAIALVKDTSQVDIPEGMVVDQIMIFDKDGKFVRAVAGDPYVPDSEERPDSAVQE